MTASAFLLSGVTNVTPSGFLLSGVTNVEVNSVMFKFNCSS